MENSIAIKIHSHQGEILVAACDEQLLGKSFEEGELQLQVHETFYDGFRANDKDLINHLSNSTIANLVGEYVVKCVLEAGLISKDSIIHIQGIPHAQIFRMC
jgi:hypothetical protein